LKNGAYAAITMVDGDDDGAMSGVFRARQPDIS
jgi:hypothetical protein